jgi:hypothetical protein
MSPERAAVKCSAPTIGRNSYRIMGPLFGVLELRLADAHLPPAEFEAEFELSWH